jgi:hypothetical protein
MTETRIQDLNAEQLDQVVGGAKVNVQSEQSLLAAASLNLNAVRYETAMAMVAPQPAAVHPIEYRR